MKIQVSEFTGIAPRQNPRYLPNGGSQQAINLEAFGAALRPLKGHGAVLSGVTLANNAKSVYRADMGGSGSSQYWMSWSSPTDVCRSQIAGDGQEWTFFTTAGTYPRATQHGATLGDCEAIGTPPYPSADVRLGITPPDGPLSGAVTYASRETFGAKIVLTPSILASLTNWDFVHRWCPFRISLDNGTQWFYPTGKDANGVALTPLTAFSPTIVLSADNLTHFATDAGLRCSIDGWVTQAFSAIASNSAADVAAALNSLTYLNQRMVDATVTGGGTTVTVVSRRSGATVEMFIAYGADNYAQSFYAKGTAFTPAAIKPYLLGEFEDVNHAGVKIIGAHYFSVTDTQSITGGATDSLAIETQPYCFDPNTNAVDTTNTTQATCETANHWWIGNGEARHLTFLWGDNFQYNIHSQGSIENKGSYESRVYAFTWIADFGDFVWESDMSLPSAVANVYADSVVNVLRRYPGLCTGGSGLDATEVHSEAKCKVAGGTWTPYDFTGTCSIAAHNDNEAACLGAGGTFTYAHGTPPLIDPPSSASGYFVNGLRLYRATAGTYLLVAEGSVNDIYFNDDRTADELQGPCLSIGWEEPPAALTGIVNLPNGIIAGFKGRDVYFCEPYRPYAWPSTYVQTVDYPIVGLGVIDTTLVVLTKGTPYFMQGTHPATLAVVKSDLRQACVSKASIVSMAGSVIYASPDGLVLLTPGGSSVVTEGIFKRTDWQAITPSNLFAFEHDGMYVAFHGSQTLPDGKVAYGFILDAKTKQFVRHNIQLHHESTDSVVTCGFSDLVNDTLYLCDGARLVPMATDTSNMTGYWTSKQFSLPQVTGFNCAQVEASNYPVTCAILCDGAVIHTQTVSGPDPFRLPPKPGRMWEVKLTTAYEVHNVVLAQSMDEIATA